MTYAISIAPAQGLQRGQASYIAFPPLPRNDNNPSDGRCPVCHGLASTAPSASEYCGKGIVHHHWRCRSCNHSWVTVVHVPAENSAIIAEFCGR